MAGPLLLLALAAAGPSPASPPEAPRRHAGRPFISPMGEPFPVKGSGDDPLADWFAGADRNRDGSITLDEMQLDADRFFAVLDLDHNGEIDPDEINHYENVIAPQIRTAFASAFIGPVDGPGHGPHGGHHGGGKWGGRGSNDNLGQGAARYGLLDLPEPVVAADTDFNRGVSREEFRKAAQLRFQALDVDRQGRLTLGVLETLHPAPPAREKRDPDAPPDLDPNADTGGQG